MMSVENKISDILENILGVEIAKDLFNELQNEYKNGVSWDRNQ